MAFYFQCAGDIQSVSHSFDLHSGPEGGEGGGGGGRTEKEVEEEEEVEKRGVWFCNERNQTAEQQLVNTSAAAEVHDSTALPDPTASEGNAWLLIHSSINLAPYLSSTYPSIHSSSH